MTRFLFAISIVTALFANAFADIQISASVKDRDKISGVIEIRVTVTATSTVNQVEFYVNGDLRSTDTSTPYTYTLDTIPEKEGPLKLEIGAYTSSGESKKTTINLAVDNEIGKGAAFHVENARRFLNVAKWEEAIQAARVALKADENSSAAKIAMARAYLGKGQYDKAQQWGEDAVISEETVEATDLLAGIHAERAFRIISMSGDKGDAMKEISNALKAAIAQKLSSVNLRIKELGPVTDANRMRHVDLLLEKHDYSAARRLLMAKWDPVNPDLQIGNKLIYSTMRSGRMAEAYKLLDDMKKKSVTDATTFGLLGAGHAYFRHWAEAADALKEGGFDDGDNPALMTASAYMALLRGDKSAASSQIGRMLKMDINSAEVYFYLFALQFYAGQFTESSDSFRKALVLDPLLYDAYVERGYQALYWATSATGDQLKDKPILLEQAKAFFDLGLAVKPDSPAALNGLALTYLYQKKPQEALSMAVGAVGAGPEYPWTHFTLAAAYNANADPKSAVKAVDKGGELDTVVLKGRGIPTTDEAWTYTYRHARIPVVMLPR